MYMKIKDPLSLRRMFADKGILTQSEMSNATGLHARTIKKALDGDPLRYKSIRQMSEYLGVKEIEIAEFVAGA